MTDAMVMLGFWVFCFCFGLGLYAYLQWQEDIEKVLAERERRRAEWYFWWHKEGLTRKPKG